MDTFEQNFLAEEKQRILSEIWYNVPVEIHQKQNNKVKSYFPLMRMKTIMKLDENVGPITTEAAAAMSFMSELFIRELSWLAWLVTENRRSKIICKFDAVKAAKTYEHMDFLIDILPVSIPSYYGNNRNSKPRETQKKNTTMLIDNPWVEYIHIYTSTPS